MVPASALPHGLGQAVRGLGRSIDRLQTSIRQAEHQDAGDIWISLCESLYWVAVLYEQFKDYFTCEPARRREPESWNVIRGLVYARNRSTHALVNASWVSILFQGETGPRIWAKVPMNGKLTTVTSQPQWASLKVLPHDDKTDTRAPLYESLIAGKSLEEPLRQAHRWFESNMSDTQPRGA